MNADFSKIYSSNSVEFGAISRHPVDPPLIVADTRRLNEEVGWKPVFSLYEGLDMTIKSLRKYLS